MQILILALKDTDSLLTASKAIGIRSTFIKDGVQGILVHTHGVGEWGVRSGYRETTIQKTKRSNIHIARQSLDGIIKPIG
jgi:hypothetical protein